jgi:hypothetical protein
MSDQQQFIICNPVHIPPAVEAEKVNCCECGQEVWLSKSGKSQAPEANTICTICARKIQGEISLPNEEVLRECAEKLGRPIEEVRERLTQIIKRGNGEIDPIEFAIQAAAAAEGEDFVKITNPAIRDENGKLPVDKIFASPGTSFPFFKAPPFETPEDLMNDFDKPEELMVYRPGGIPGGMFIIRKSHLGWIQQRESVVDRVLQSHGYTQENMHTAPWATIMAMRKEIQRQTVELN